MLPGERTLIFLTRCYEVQLIEPVLPFNPIAVRMAKTLWKLHRVLAILSAIGGQNSMETP